MGGAAKAPVSFVKGLVTHPVDTVSGVPKGAYELVENASVSVSTTRNPAEDSRTEQLQKHLNSIAGASTLGDWAFSAVMLPAGATGSVVSNVRLANSMTNVLKDEPPQRLRIVNDETLTRLGIPADVRKRFRDQPLAGVAGLDAFLNVAGDARDEGQANFYVAMAQPLIERSGHGYRIR
jgi:hypothetical protein